MRTQSPDTSPEAEKVLVELLRRAPAWRKLRMIEDCNRTMKAAAFAGLRSRYPSDTKDELERRYAELVLGADVAAKVFQALSK